MILTKQTLDDLLKRGASKKGAWSRKQLESIGAGWPAVAGWKDRLIGTELSEDQVNSFLSMKDQHLKGKRTLEALQVAVHGYLRHLKESENVDADSKFKNVIFEQALEYFEGPGVWDRVNELRP